MGAGTTCKETQGNYSQNVRTSTHSNGIWNQPKRRVYIFLPSGYFNENPKITHLPTTCRLLPRVSDCFRLITISIWLSHLMLSANKSSIDLSIYPVSPSCIFARVGSYQQTHGVVRFADWILAQRDWHSPIRSVLVGSIVHGSLLSETGRLVALEYLYLDENRLLCPHY